MTTDYILKAIEHVERNASWARERIERERTPDATQPSGDAATSTLATVDAELEEIGRIERQASAARRDFEAIYGEDRTTGEAAA